MEEGVGDVMAEGRVGLVVDLGWVRLSGQRMRGMGGGGGIQGVLL